MRLRRVPPPPTGTSAATATVETSPPPAVRQRRLPRLSLPRFGVPLRPSAALADLLALAVLALCALLLHWSALAGGPAYYERDTALFYYPLSAWVGEQLKAGYFPLWLPDIFTGYPIFADGELGLLYLPQVLLLWWLPTPLAMAWLRVLHVFLAGAFFYLFARWTLRLNPMASLGGSLVFAFGSFFTAQMHHENVVRSAVWLPLVLALGDRALRSTDRRGWAWLSLAALAFAQAALGLHVQPVLMIALTLGAWVVFRFLVGWPGWRVGRGGQPLAASASRLRVAWRRLAAPRWSVLVVAGVVGGGVALALAQWVPLFEWARTSFRRTGVSFEFASAFGIAGENLPTLLFPYFFRLPDGGTWWMLWQQWEILLYVGIPTLALCVVGLLSARRREGLFFLVLGGVALLLAMTHYAPFNLHEALWSLPGFSFLRAPGRFSYLVVFAAAGLAALGLQALVDRTAPLNRLVVLAVGALPPVVLLASVLALFPAWRAWLLADPARGIQMAQERYLSVRAQWPIDPQVVYQGTLASLDLLNPKTTWSVVLLGLTAVAFVAWMALGPRRAVLSQTLFVYLLAADLLVFAADFHPRAPFQSLGIPPIQGVPPGARVFVRDASTTTLPNLEPNLPLTAGVRISGGYSSLPSLRHVDLYTQSQGRSDIIRYWAAPYVLEPLAPPDLYTSAGVRFRSEHPLVAGYANTSTTRFRIPAEWGAVQSLRVVSTLGTAFDLQQGTPVGDIRVFGKDGSRTLLHLRAGIETAERAFDRPSLKPFLQHQRPPGPTALDIEDVSTTGEVSMGHLYLAELPLPAPTEIAAIEVLPVNQRAFTQVFGIGLVGADGTVQSLEMRHGEEFRYVADDRVAGVQVLEYLGALPRAQVRDRAQTVYRATRPAETPVQIITSTEFEPDLAFLIESPQPFEDYGERPPRPDPRLSARLEERGPNRLIIRAESDRPAYLVVADQWHRGWNAWVDGDPAPVYIANAVFRGVPVEAGSYLVEMRFQPLSHILGALASLLALVACLAVAAWGFLSGRSTPRA